MRSARVGRNSPTPKPYEIDTGDLGPPLTDSPRDTFTIQPEFTGHVCSPKVLEASSHIGGFVPTVASCSVSCRIFVQASGPSLITFLSRGGKISQNGARITQHRGPYHQKTGARRGTQKKRITVSLPYHYRITGPQYRITAVSLPYHWPNRGPYHQPPGGRGWVLTVSGFPVCCRAIGFSCTHTHKIFGPTIRSEVNFVALFSNSDEAGRCMRPTEGRPTGPGMEHPNTHLSILQSLFVVAGLAQLASLCNVRRTLFCLGSS